MSKNRICKLRIISIDNMISKAGFTQHTLRKYVCSICMENLFYFQLQMEINVNIIKKIVYFKIGFLKITTVFCASK